MADNSTTISLGVDVKGARQAQEELNKLNKAVVEGQKEQIKQGERVQTSYKKTVEAAKGAAAQIKRIWNAGQLNQQYTAPGLHRDASGRLRSASGGFAKNPDYPSLGGGGAGVGGAPPGSYRDGSGRLRNARGQYIGGAGGGGGGGGAGGGSGGGISGGGGSGRGGAFGQGFLEGALPGNLSRIIDRGPGAGHQAAGIMAGSVLSHLASVPLTGMGGIMGAAGAIGSVASAPLQRIMAGEGQALDRQRGQLGLQYLMGGYGLRRLGGRGLGSQMSDSQLDAEATRRAASGNVSGLSNQDQALIYGNARFATQQRLNALPEGRRADLLRLKGGNTTDKMIPEELTRARVEALKFRARKELLEQRTAGQNAAADPSVLADLGRNYGAMNLGQTQQFVGNMAYSAGGNAGDLASEGLIRSGLAAQTRYGISGDISGAFGTAARVGGLVGGKGQGGAEGLAKTIGEAVALKLDGSDLVKYVAQTADGIKQFQQTGIPLASGAISRVAEGLEGIGVSGAMASSGGFGMAQKLQSIGDNGPQDAFDVTAMQALGGDQSTLEGQLGAQKRLRNLSGEDANKVFSYFGQLIHDQSGGTGNVGEEQVRQLAKRLQLPTDAGTVKQLSRRIASGKFNLAGIKKGAKLDAATLDEQGAQSIDPALKTQTDIENAGADTGEAGIAASQNSEQTAQIAAKAYAGAIAPTLTGVTGALLKLTQFLETHMASEHATRAMAGAKTSRAAGAKDGR